MNNVVETCEVTGDILENRYGSERGALMHVFSEQGWNWTREEYAKRDYERGEKYDKAPLDARQGLIKHLSTSYLKSVWKFYDGKGGYRKYWNGHSYMIKGEDINRWVDFEMHCTSFDRVW